MQINHTNLLDLSTSSSKQIGDRKHTHRDEEEKRKNIISFVKQRKMYYSIYLQYKYRSKIIIQTEIEQFYAKRKVYST